MAWVPSSKVTSTCPRSPITYLATDEGWFYVAAIKDLFAGEIVGRAFGARMTTGLVVRALAQVVTARRPEAGLIHHSDRGSQYCSHEYPALLRRHRLRVMYQLSLQRAEEALDRRVVVAVPLATHRGPQY